MKNHFGKDIIPSNDEDRLTALYRYRLVQSVPKGYFTKLADIIAKTFNTPIALVSIVEKEKVLFLGNHGMDSTYEVSRGLSLCSLAVLDDEPTIFEDALKEPCLLTNPLVTGEFGLRFYAGAPIMTADGYAIGTACIVAKEPRKFEKADKELLKYFAHLAMQEIELRFKMLSTDPSFINHV